MRVFWKKYASDEEIREYSTQRELILDAVTERVFELRQLMNSSIYVGKRHEKYERRYYATKTLKHRILTFPDPTGDPNFSLTRDQYLQYMSIIDLTAATLELSEYCVPLAKLKKSISSNEENV